MSSRTEYSARTTKPPHHTPPRPGWSPCVAVLSRETSRRNHFQARIGYSPLTLTGVDELVVVPSPSSPWLLTPQHFAAPLANSAHEWMMPAETAAAFDTPATGTGVDELVVVPFPNCPKLLSPQHFAVPFANNAHEWPAPAVIATALVRP